MLLALFEDRARPLYGQADRFRLERLDVDPAYDFISERFSATGKSAGEAAIELVLAADGHPRRLMLLAHVLWNRIPHAGEATTSDVRGAYNEALRMVDPELRYLWDSLTHNERRVLAALASSFSPFQLEAQAMTGLSTRSSAARAVETLPKRSSSAPIRTAFASSTRCSRAGSVATGPAAMGDGAGVVDLRWDRVWRRAVRALPWTGRPRSAVALGARGRS